MNELNVLESKIDYYKNKSELDLVRTTKILNDRINKLVLEVDNLRDELHGTIQSKK